ncbi:MAG: E3 ubiquitin protein ligase [Candidatus Heimdallarchaeum endolithica]|uniref:E3 ubiquitin protein ligase n=1 Tax=Candidatus Heimdallarchaeum endolithica TaxID=2876572 RepID=A0A9Y1FQN8_9ARCH|nr:MAG: E3 ubiquitin protein ligase [Candidatus Heimdallarchaeum endolithica]
MNFNEKGLDSSFSVKLNDVFSNVKYYLYIDEPITLEISVLVNVWGKILLEDEYTGLTIFLLEEEDETILHSWLISVEDEKEHYLKTNELKPGIYVLKFENSFVQEIVFSWSLNNFNPTIWNYNSLVNLSQTNKLYFSLERIPDHFTELKKLHINIIFYDENISSLDIAIRNQSNNTIYSWTFEGPTSHIFSQLILTESIKKVEWFSIVFNETKIPSSFASISLFYDHAIELNIVRLFLVKTDSPISSIPIDSGREYSFKIEKWYESEEFFAFLRFIVVLLRISLYSGPFFISVFVIVLIMFRKRRKKQNQSFEFHPSSKYKKAQYSPENAIRVDFSSIPKDFKLVGTSKMRLKCGICFQSINDLENSIRCPSCDNIFHKNHLYQWIIQKGTCPTCKAKLRIAT